MTDRPSSGAVPESGSSSGASSSEASSSDAPFSDASSSGEPCPPDEKLTDADPGAGNPGVGSPREEDPDEEAPGEEDAGPGIADGNLRALSPRFYTVQLIWAWIFSGIVVVLLLVGLFLSWVFEWIGPDLAFWFAIAWPLVSGFICWIDHVYPGWEYGLYRYRLSRDGIEIRRGVFWRSVISVPRSRVQHTDVSQGPIQRHFGIATLTIHTAGTQDASVELGGLDHATAIDVRDYLIQGGEDDAV